jgi:hypothetical protein
MANQESENMSKEPKKNRLPIAAFIISIIVLLFGNNIIGRLFTNNPPILNNNIVDSNKLLTEETTENTDEDLNHLSDEEIAKKLISDIQCTEFDQIIKDKKYSRGLEILNIAQNQTLQPILLKNIENKKKGIFLMMEENFDNVFFDFPANVVLTQYNDKYGLYSRDGKEIFSPIYDEIDPLSFEPLLLTIKNKKYGLLDKDGKELFSPIFSEIEIYFEPLYLVKENGKYGFINLNGEMIIPPTFSEVMSSGDIGLIKIQKFDEWGVIDTLGQQIIGIKYDTIGNFDNNGIAYAKYQGQNIFINKKGVTVKNPAFK